MTRLVGGRGVLGAQRQQHLENDEPATPHCTQDGDNCTALRSVARDAGCAGQDDRG